MGPNDRIIVLPWGNEDTQQLIDIMAKYNVKATFFVVGEWVDKYPESVKALHDAGHEIMSHSNDHAHFNSLSTDEIIADLNACNDKIEAVTGVRPTLFRCPYGEYDDHVINAVRSMGIEPIQWDVEHLETEESHCAPRVCGVFCSPGSTCQTPKSRPAVFFPKPRRQASFRSIYDPPEVRIAPGSPVPFLSWSSRGYQLNSVVSSTKSAQMIIY